MDDRDAHEQALAAETLERAAIGVLRVATDGAIAYANQYICAYLGYPFEELTRLTIFDVNPTLTRETWPEHSRRFVGATVKAFESVHRRKSGSLIPVEIRVTYVEVDGVGWFVACSRDLSEQKLAESERDHLTAQLSQARKLESLGRLAGGVAHDFNNTLSVILLAAEHGLELGAVDAALRVDLEEICAACYRSADLTRQLLAFARQQPIRPRGLDLAAVIDGMLKMLRRVIGDPIELCLEAGPGLWPVRLDPVQVDQIITNLVLNARDAIAGHGRVVIEARNVTVDAARPSAHELAPGDYVLLAVRDTGHGMDAAVLPHVFEPFFTTKQLGRGTGLGLATVFGIVGQNGGVIRVDSPPGGGTAFSLYFPRAGDRPDEEVTLAPARGEPRGTETILLVEDDPRVLRLTAGVLETLGYEVLSAGGADEALALVAQHGPRVHLLVTDMLMPQMSGAELARQVQARWPAIAVLFVSGDAAELALGPRRHVLQKPLSRHQLAQAVRRVLDEPPPPAPDQVTPDSAARSRNV